MCGIKIYSNRCLTLRLLSRRIWLALFAAAVSVNISQLGGSLAWAQQSSASLADQEEAAMRAAVKTVEDSIVQIRTIGGLDSVEGTLLADGPTTGLIISADGYIVSSAFNFAQQPASILVTFSSGKQAPAELLATDHSRMLVLLRVEGVADLQVPEFAPAGDARPGEWAIAVGKTYRVDRTNVSVGIVSAVNRMFGKVLQTDADVSTANYGGPLIDLRGRVLGVIVPMAPQATSDVAGIEWYDSGIGFAVPLAPIMDRLEKMKRREDQRSGIMGIAMATENPHSSPAELAVVRPDSPAGKAGLKKGDRLIEIEGKPIKTQTDLRFALGTRYDGESVKVIAMRGETRIETTVTLAGQLAPFRHAFLGILPMRPAQAKTEKGPGKDDKKGEEKDESSAQEKTDNEDTPITEPIDNSEANTGIVVRMVYPGSPAAEAGVQVDDRIVRIGETEVATVTDAIRELNSVAPEQQVTLQVNREGKPIELTLVTERLPTGVPNSLPPAVDASTSGKDQSGVATGQTHELKLPEFPQQCHIYVPASEASGRPLGVLLWIRASDDVKPEELIREWQPICDRDGLLLVIPESSNADRWERTELPYLRKLLERVIRQNEVDGERIVVAGRAGSGDVTWLLGLASRDVVRGMATIAAPLPRQVRVPPNEPSQRLAVFAGMPVENEFASSIEQGLQKLTEAGYPVTTVTSVNPVGQFSQNEREELARWVDSLDRF